MVAWPVVAVGLVGVVGGAYFVYRYGWREPEVMEPTGVPGYVLRKAGLYDSTLARRLLITVLGVLFAGVGGLVAWLGWLLE
jgi:hypothetical protein